MDAARTLLFALLCCGLCTPQAGGGVMRVDERLFKAESEHFVYIVEESLLDDLTGFMKDCKDAYGVLTPLFNWEPMGKTVVLYSDAIDTHNGWALAIWSETEFVGPGRGRNAIADMIFRTAYVDDCMLNGTKWDTSLPEWPFGSAAYLYGMKAIEHAHLTHGVEDGSGRNVPATILDDVSLSFSWFFNRRARRTTGKSFRNAKSASTRTATIPTAIPSSSTLRSRRA